MDSPMDPTSTATPIPTPSVTSAATVPVAILAALSRAIVEWTAAVYPGTTAYLEVASRDFAARHPHIWHATARLSNSMRLRFTLVVYDDGATACTACITYHARLATPSARNPALGMGTPQHGWEGQNRGQGRPRPRADSGPYRL